MADLTITAANVKATSNTGTILVQFGEAVDQGETVYLKAADWKHWLSDNSTTALAAAVGICLTSNIADGYGLIAVSGDIDLGSTLSVGEVYTCSSTAGKIHPDTDLATTEILTVLGFGKTAALFTLGINQTGIAHV